MHSTKVHPIWDINLYFVIYYHFMIYNKDVFSQYESKKNLNKTDTMCK